MAAPKLLKGPRGRPTNISQGKMPPASSALGKSMRSSGIQGEPRQRPDRGPARATTAKDTGEISFGNTGGAISRPIMGIGFDDVD